jgi:hypothetical protein
MPPRARTLEGEAGTTPGTLEDVRTALAACGTPPEKPLTRVPDAANPPDAPRCARITDGIASSSTATDPNIIRGFMILSAAP